MTMTNALVSQAIQQVRTAADGHLVRFQDDLVHDARFITEIDAAPFAWACWPIGTFICRAGSEPIDPVGNMSWQLIGTIEGCHGRQGVRYRYWDGSCLQVCASARDLQAALRNAAWVATAEVAP